MHIYYSYYILLILKNNFEGIIYILFAIWGIKASDRIICIDYRNINKIVKENKTYYIILNRYGVFIDIDKDNFIIGNVEEMMSFLNEKINIEIN